MRVSLTRLTNLPDSLSHSVVRTRSGVEPLVCHTVDLLELGGKQLLRVSLIAIGLASAGYWMGDISLRCRLGI